MVLPRLNRFAILSPLRVECPGDGESDRRTRHGWQRSVWIWSLPRVMHLSDVMVRVA